jgi:hypothetical protein
MPVSGGLYKKDSPICMWKHQELRRKEKDCTALVRCEDLSTFYGPRKTRDTRLVPKGEPSSLSRSRDGERLGQLVHLCVLCHRRRDPFSTVRR